MSEVSEEGARGAAESQDHDLCFEWDLDRKQPTDQAPKGWLRSSQQVARSPHFANSAKDRWGDIWTRARGLTCQMGDPSLTLGVRKRD